MASEVLALRFVNVLGMQGGKSGNLNLRKALGWKLKTYEKVRDNLLSSGIITKGRGRGGSVALASNQMTDKNFFQKTIELRSFPADHSTKTCANAVLQINTSVASIVLENKPKDAVKTKITSLDVSGMKIDTAYKTPFGQMIHGSIEKAFQCAPLKSLCGQVNLLITSPPFPLVRKKKYGNKNGEAYVEWLRTLASSMSDLIAEDGSIVIEIGNAWEEGSPVMSTLPLEALLAFKQAANLHLCQHIICHNPARLPSPAAWVNVNRIRLKDSYTHVWWMSKNKYPKADNRKVLNPYSNDMKKLLKAQKYNAGLRPSGHVISQTGFLTDHGGSIGPNVVDLTGKHFPEALLKFTGTKWDGEYRNYCKERNLPAHPARMQSALVAFFIQFLTDEKDLVLDPFAGSNTTGSVAEQMNRRWVSVEANKDYISGSRGRFEALRV